MKRIYTLLLTLALLLSAVPLMSVAADQADEREYIVLAGSDFQTIDYNTQNVEWVLNTLAHHGIAAADHAFFVGDYTKDDVTTNSASPGIQALKNLFAPLVGNKTIFVQGNHDHEKTVGFSPAGDNDPAHGGYGAFVIHEDSYRDWGNVRSETAAVAEDLRAYLEQKHRSGWDRPIFVLGHVPLHWSNRTIVAGSGTDADLLYTVLEEYGNKGMNIFYLYGHNHSGGYDDFLGGAAVYLKKGDAIEVCHGNPLEHETHTLSFTYMTPGFMGYYGTTVAEVDTAVTMTVFRIKGDEVIVTRYDGNFTLGDGRYGIHNLKSQGVQHPNFSQEGYHPAADTRVYTSSRKVTATIDLPAETPLPMSILSNPDAHSFPTRSLSYTAPLMTGDDVIWVQASLNKADFSIAINGQYDAKTRDAVRRFQSCYGLEVSGECDFATRMKLQEVWASKRCHHAYSSVCDTTCNTCGATRLVWHRYSNACDAVCNTCNAVRTPSDHYWQNDRCAYCGVLAPVIITAQPKTTYAAYGEIAAITVKAHGEGLRYQWYVCDDETTNYVKSATTTATYKLKMTLANSNRKAYCVVTDKDGNAVTSATARLRVRATLTALPATAAYAKMGEKVSVKITAMGDGLQYRWYIKNDGQTAYSLSSVTNATYTTTMSEKAKNRRLYCVVKDKYGKQVTTKTFLLRESVSVAEPSTATYAKKGASAKVTLKTFGDGLTYTWYIKNASSTKYTRSSITTATYSVKMSDKVNGPRLYCVVKDKYGNTVTTKTMILKMK